MKLDRMEDAVLALVKAVSLDPKSFNPRLNLGIAYMRRQDFSSGEPHLRQAVGIDSSSALAHMYLGILLSKVSKPDEAEDELHRAVSLGGADLAVAPHYLGQLYIGRDRIVEAIGELEAYLKEKPNAEDAQRVRDQIADLRGRLK
jgi:tetratricopeptide (TPR) repeat protein